MNQEIYGFYARVSSDEQKERASINSQLEAAKKYARQNNIKITHTYLDDGITSRVPLHKRESGSKLCEDIKKKKITALIFFDTTRLGGEDEWAFMDSFRFLLENNVKIISLSEYLPTENQASFLFGSLAQHASFQAFRLQKIKHAVKSGHTAHALRGEWQGGRAPYGYMVGPDRKLTLNPETAPIVERIFNLYAGGHSTLQIERILNDEGIPSPFGKKWHDTVITKMLSDTVYTGEHRYGKTTTIIKEGVRVDRKATSQSEQIINKIPPIISKQLWNKVQKQKESMKQFSKRNSKNFYILKGLIRCGVCGYGFIGRFVTARNTRYYGCVTQQRGKREKPCTNKYIRADDLETIIWTGIRELTVNPEAVREEVLAIALQKSEQDKDHKKKLKQIEKQIEQKQEERKRVVELCVKGRLTVDETDEMLSGIETAILTLEQSKLETEYDLNAADDLRASIDAVIEALKNVEENPKEEVKAETCRMLIEKVVVYPDRSCKVYFKFEVQKNVAAKDLYGCPSKSQATTLLRFISLDSKRRGPKSHQRRGMP